MNKLMLPSLGLGGGSGLGGLGGGSGLGGLGGPPPSGDERRHVKKCIDDFSSLYSSLQHHGAGGESASVTSSGGHGGLGAAVSSRNGIGSLAEATGNVQHISIPRPLYNNNPTMHVQLGPR